MNEPSDQARPADELFNWLQPSRLTAVVDIGANPIDCEPPYKTMLASGICRVVGFEPQRPALEALQQRRGPLETYLPDAISDGTAQTLYTCVAPGMTSLLKPDPKALAIFPLFSDFGRLISNEPIETRPLDSIAEIVDLDFLKIDVQGSELTILRSARQKLAHAVVVHTEVSFVPLYESQPSIGDVDLELRSQGFIPHALVELKRWIIAPMVVNKNPRVALNQLMEADLVYVRDFRNPDAMTDGQLKHMAVIAHHCYRSFDLALHCLMALERRGCVAKGANERYLTILRSKPS
jgi:FkbM family methyltransferase